MELREPWCRSVVHGDEAAQFDQPGAAQLVGFQKTVDISLERRTAIELNYRHIVP